MNGYGKRINSFDQMSSLSKNIRELLKTSFEFNSAKIDKEFLSNDGTIKYSMKLHDNKLIEGTNSVKKKSYCLCFFSSRM